MAVDLTPILTARAVAHHLDMPESTLDRWITAQAADAPLIHAVTPAIRNAPRMPFIAVVETYVLRALRDQGFSLPRIQAAAALVREEFGDEYALASQRIAHDGVDLFVQLADLQLVRTDDRQSAIREVLADHLRYITWDNTGRPARLQLKLYGDACPVVIDPRFNWGGPVLEKGLVPVDSLVDLWNAGEKIDTIAGEFGLTRDVTEDVLRAARRRAA